MGNGPRSGFGRLTLLLVFALLLLVGTPSRAALALKPFAEGFTSPLALVPLPDGSGRLLLCDQLDTVQVLDKEGKVSEKLTSVTGGYVYRGSAIPQLHGRYVFADWSRLWVKADGVLFVATRPPAKEAKPWTLETLDLPTHPGGRVGKYVVALGQDAEGELYFLTNDSNRVAGKADKVFKLVSQ